MGGFTLIELALVVVVIGLLAAIVLPSYVKLKNKAREAQAKASLHDIQTDLEQYGVDREGTYPAYLIGGDNRWLTLRVGEDRHVTTTYQETPLDACSDPLLRGGYVNSYPVNPFSRNTQAVQLLQRQMGDPLRSSFVDGRELGTRFGASGNIMGQCLCDARWLQWLYYDPVANEQLLKDTWCNVQYEFYDIWLGNLQKPFLPGSFMYKSVGEFVPSPGDSKDRNVIRVDNHETLVPEGTRGEATYPISLSQYVLAAWGGFHTKGMDLLGEEPLVIFTFHGTKRLAPPAFVYNPETGLYELPPAPASDTYELLGIPPWTRGVNRSHIGPLWGSPYGPTARADLQLAVGNPNGLKDALILILSSGED